MVAMFGCDSTCRATSAEAGLKPKPVGAFSSSSTPLTPGLKWSSTWKRSSEVRSCRGSNSKQMFLHNVALHFYFIFNQVAKFTLQKLTQKMAAYDKNKSTKLYLIVVLIQHDDNLSHIVEFRDSTEVIHGTLPLLVLLLLSQTQTKTQVQLSSSSEKHSKRPVELVLGCLHRANLHSGKC